MEVVLKTRSRLSRPGVSVRFGLIEVLVAHDRMKIHRDVVLAVLNGNVPDEPGVVGHGPCAVERPGVAVDLIFNLGKARAEFARRIAAQHAQGSAE